VMADVSSIGDSSPWDNGYDNFEATDGESKAGPCATKTQAEILIFGCRRRSYAYTRRKVSSIRILSAKPSPKACEIHSSSGTGSQDGQGPANANNGSRKAHGRLSPVPMDDEIAASRATMV